MKFLYLIFLSFLVASCGKKISKKDDVVKTYDVYRGNIHYIIFNQGNNVQVVNYTSDSIDYVMINQ